MAGIASLAVQAVTIALVIQVSVPVKTATLEVKGEPIRLAWAADGGQLAIQTAEHDKAGIVMHAQMV